MAPDIILFDGDCAYCNGWVKWITKRDSGKRFRFAPLDSEEGTGLLRKHGVSDGIDSIVLVKDGNAYTRSDAAWRVLKGLPGWAFSGQLLRLIPRPIRDWGYAIVARNRHRLGLQDSCELPEHRG